MSALHRVQVPTLAGTVEAPAPPSWEITRVAIPDAPSLSEQALYTSITDPRIWAAVEAKPIKNSAAIVVEDISRPAPTHLILPFILDKLNILSIPDERIKIIVAVACHRPLTGMDLRKKIGSQLLERVEVLNHNPYENLAFVGTSPSGLPVYINKYVAEADIRIGLGSIVPHPGAGFGGGAKLLVPGVAGLETIHQHHNMRGPGCGQIEGNRFRETLEEAAALIGLDLSINVVVNSRIEIAGIFAGDPIGAHRQGAAFADRLYRACIARTYDIAIVGSYPADLDLVQGVKAISAGSHTAVRAGGTLVMVGWFGEGVGHHTLLAKGGRVWPRPKERMTATLEGKSLVVVSPHISRYEAWQSLPDGTRVFGTLQEALESLATTYPSATAVLFPLGCLTLVTRV